LLFQVNFKTGPDVRVAWQLSRAVLKKRESRKKQSAALSEAVSFHLPCAC